MNKSLLAALNDAERLLVAETGTAALALLDEHAVGELLGHQESGPGEGVYSQDGHGQEGGCRTRRTVTAAPAGDRALRSPARENKRAGTTAKGMRRQAKRDMSHVLMAVGQQLREVDPTADPEAVARW